MKAKYAILKLSIALLLFAVVTTGCQKDDIFELYIGDEDVEIIHEVNGIEFKFCLLNEQGQPATVFNEGENFSFRFSIKNKTEESLNYNDRGFVFLKEFFEVNSKNKSYGKPYEIISRGQTKEMKYIHPGSKRSIQLPWSASKEFPIAGYSARGLNKNPLKPNNYYTEFSHKFVFGSNIKLEKLTFKINFKIQ